MAVSAIIVAPPNEAESAVLKIMLVEVELRPVLVWNKSR
jgi:hypothetical protein